jgi:Ca2+-binding EF-hand superfamily protein
MGASTATVPPDASIHTRSVLTSWEGISDRTSHDDDRTPPGAPNYKNKANREQDSNAATLRPPATADHLSTASSPTELVPMHRAITQSPAEAAGSGKPAAVVRKPAVDRPPPIDTPLPRQDSGQYGQGNTAPPSTQMPPPPSAVTIAAYNSSVGSGATASPVEPPRTPAGALGMSIARGRSRRPPPVTPSSRVALYPSESHSNVAEIAEAFRVLTNEASFDAVGLHKLMKAHGHSQATEDEVRELIKAIDQTGDGVVRFQEFAALMALPVELLDVEEMKSAFEHLDREGRGWIPAADFTKLMATYGDKSTPEECEEMLRFADPEETGRVNYSIFLGTLAYRLQPRL